MKKEELEKLASEGFELKKAGQYSEALEKFRIAAEHGDASAQRELGCAYLFGDKLDIALYQVISYCGHDFNITSCWDGGVQQNFEEAVKWFFKAAGQGDVTAQECLGFCYTVGHGVEEDRAEAIKWLSKADSMGANAALGFLYMGENYKKAVEYYEKVVSYCKPLSITMKRILSSAQWRLWKIWAKDLKKRYKIALKMAKKK